MSPNTQVQQNLGVASRLSPRVWLALGIAVMALCGYRGNVALLAWVAVAPWLVYLRLTSGWRSRLLLAAAVQIACALQIATIITAPIPWFFVPLFSVPLAMGATVALILAEGLRRHLGDRWGLVVVPAIVVIGEWLSFSTTELGSWGAMAYTQLDNLPLLQSASLVGITGIAWLTTATGTWVAQALCSSTPRRLWPSGALIIALVIGVHAFGAWRLARAKGTGERITAAAVVTDIGLDGGELPSKRAIARATETLFARSLDAARRGAQLIVWNEGATVVEKSQETRFLRRAETLARTRRVDLVVAYVVPLQGMRRFENKYVWLTAKGIAETYHKHHPVPGEGSIRGEAPLRVLTRPYGKVAGAICYDYDFPAMARAHGRGGAGIVALPSSDWRGIDPLHSKMSRLRAIEGGFALLRPVRWAHSVAYDRYGRTLATMSWFDDPQRVMLARIPTRGEATLYARLGDVLPVANAALLGLALVVLFARRLRAVTS